MEFKIGDWIILKDQYIKNVRKAKKIVDIEEGEDDSIIVIFIDERELRRRNYSEPFRLATESEIKKEQLRNIFRTKM